MTTLLLFLIILAVLIISHEFGHFIVAKKNGVRVDEFGLGFPPRIFGIKRGETLYSLNWIPFGGFVRIFGENPDNESMSGADSKRSLVNKPKRVQAAVLAAGVICNLILAWLLISVGFINGLPASTSSFSADKIPKAELTITSILPESPAAKAGLKSGDTIVGLQSDGQVLSVPSVDEAQKFLAASEGREVVVGYRRGSNTPMQTATVIPVAGVVAGKAAIGVSMDMVGIFKLNILEAFWRGLLFTGSLIVSTTIGLGTFFAQLISGGGSSALSQVTGPVGLVGMVGDASNLGLSYLLSFTALISINLAVINMIPFPALDGGRLLFLAIEAIKGSRINPRVANTLNMVGFSLLIILMLAVTYADIGRLFVK